MLTQRKALVLVTLVLLCCALLNPRWTSWPTGALTHTVNTLQYPADWLASELKSDPPVDGPEQSTEDLKNLLESAQYQNADLWIENRKLNDQLENYKAIKEIRDIESIQLVEARVSRLNNDSANPTMYVLRGSLHGLKPDDAVAYKSNLVGFVTDSIGPANATVALITREGFSIGVHIKPPPKPNKDPKKKEVLLPGWPFKTRVTSDGEGKFYCSLKQKVAEGLRVGDYVRAADAIRESANGFMLGLIEKIEPDPKDPLNLSLVTIKPRAPIGPQRMVTILTERTD